MTPPIIVSRIIEGLMGICLIMALVVKAIDRRDRRRERGTPDA
jgi:hypothetical protein